MPEAPRGLPLEVPPGAVCPTHTAAATHVCARCGDYACAACRGEEGEPDGLCERCRLRAMTEAVPWDHRRELGLLRAFVQTTRMASFQPKAFFRAAASSPPSFGHLGYGVMAYAVGPTVAMTLYFAFIGVVLLASGEARAELSGPADGVGLAVGLCVGMGMTIAWMPLAGTVAIVLDALLTHLVLSVTGERPQPFDATLRTVSYANAPYVFLIVPCLGWVVAPFWMLAVEVVGLRETHRVTTGRAAFAVLGYRAILYGGLLLFYGFLVGVALMGVDLGR